MRPVAPLFITAVLAVTAGCANTETGSSGSGTLQCSTSSPLHGGDYQAVEVFSKALEEKTDGKYKVKIYPDSQLGDYESVIPQIKAGSIDCLYESIGTLATDSAVAGIEAVPYLYRDTDQFFNVWDGDIGKDLLDQVASDTGIQLIGPAFRGFRQLATKEPVNSVDDLAGLKLRVPPIPGYVSAWKALGASPTPVPFAETYSALQQGVVVGVENSLIGLNDQKFPEVASNIAITEHMAETMGFMFNAEWMKGLDDADRKAFEEAAAESADWYRDYTEKTEAELVDQFEGDGVKVTHPDLAPLRNRVSSFDPGAELKEYVEQIRALR